MTFKILLIKAVVTPDQITTSHIKLCVIPYISKLNQPEKGIFNLFLIKGLFMENMALYKLTCLLCVIFMCGCVSCNLHATFLDVIATKVARIAACNSPVCNLHLFFSESAAMLTDSVKSRTRSCNRIVFQFIIFWQYCDTNCTKIAAFRNSWR